MPAAIFGALLVCLLSAAPALPKKPRPQACAGGRFLVAGDAPLLGPILSQTGAIVIGDDPLVELGTCGRSSARRKVTSKLTLLKAKWKRCAELDKVSLVAKIGAPACTALDGTIRGKKTKAQRFTATRSRCDDALLDTVGGEECDRGFPCAAGATCANCTCQPDQGTTTTLQPIVTTTVVPGTSTTSTTIPPVVRPFVLPEDWVVTRDTGYVLEAHDPENRAFVRMLFQHWWTQGSGPATAQAYVQYWHDFHLGDVFPVDARGAQISQTEVGVGKVGGPYLRYEFDDAQHATRYVQIYASAGGINSIVFTGWAKSAEFPAVEATLDAMIESVELPAP